MEPVEFKDLVDVAMSLSPVDKRALYFFRNAQKPLASLHIAARFMLVPSKADQLLQDFLQHGLIVAKPPGDRDYVSSEQDEYFVLSDKGEALTDMLAHLKL